MFAPTRRWPIHRRHRSTASALGAPRARSAARASTARARGTAGAPGRPSVEAGGDDRNVVRAGRQLGRERADLGSGADLGRDAVDVGLALVAALLVAGTHQGRLAVAVVDALRFQGELADVGAAAVASRAGLDAQGAAGAVAGHVASGVTETECADEARSAFAVQRAPHSRCGFGCPAAADREQGRSESQNHNK